MTTKNCLLESPDDDPMAPATPSQFGLTPAKPAMQPLFTCAALSATVEIEHEESYANRVYTEKTLIVSPVNTFRVELTKLLNSHSKENGSNTPDFILANYLIGVMDVYDLTVRRRDEWRS